MDRAAWALTTSSPHWFLDQFRALVRPVGITYSLDDLVENNRLLVRHAGNIALLDLYRSQAPLSTFPLMLLLLPLDTLLPTNLLKSAPVRTGVVSPLFLALLFFDIFATVPECDASL